ncbi:MAG: adenosylmethionine--8-amino-7-oxononanoate transaminase [Thiotrichaceae bacterium]|nr:adenosylmethionine--8-amino-7-oxononanoate transaminase [Thiotrichaceae bacterium]
MISQNSLEFDKKHIWHPYSSAVNPNPVYPIESAQGVRLQLSNGATLIDGMSSWWAAIHGYNHPSLNQAIYDQTEKMAHIMFGGLTHEPAISLAQKLIQLSSDSLKKVFFADSGSVAIEVAMKMALQYWSSIGQPKKNKLLTVAGGYHGDTFGAMSVCDPVNGMHQLFSQNLMQHYFADAPYCDEATQRADLNSFTQLIEQHHQQLAAVILEPIVQGAGGMRFYCANYLVQVRALCDQYDVLLILDEIATGFGRTGSYFAYQQANIEADILVLGKALTGGYMTLAATLTSDKIAEGINHNGSGILMHGPTFMANPLACSVANASLDLLATGRWQQQVMQIEKQLSEELNICKGFSSVADVRVKGAIGVVELKQAVDMATIQQQFVDLGVWIRPFNKLIYLMPPYIIEPQELSQLTQAIITVLRNNGEENC